MEIFSTACLQELRNLQHLHKRFLKPAACDGNECLLHARIQSKEFTVNERTRERTQLVIVRREKSFSEFLITYLRCAAKEVEVSVFSARFFSGGVTGRHV